MLDAGVTYVFASYRDYNWEIYGRDGYAFSGLESRSA